MVLWLSKNLHYWGIVKIVFNLTFITYLVDFCKPNVYNTKCKIT